VDFSKSKILQEKIHALIPGGCHTYAKGDDQFPVLAPGLIQRGKGSHVWDVDGNEFIEYGMGCRAVTLGHAYEPVVEAARREMEHGENFTRPAKIELDCAEEFLGLIEGAEMVKFTKDGSSTTTAALKLARAHTGRNMVAYCGDHPFFSIDDWFIGTTAINAGIPQTVKDLSVSFRYNDLESVRRLFGKYPGQIACLIMEPAKYEDPTDNFLHRVQELCQANGTLFVLDEMITGFRWHIGGAQKYYDIVPDLSTFGKALANGFSVSALAGKREIMELGGLFHDKPRVFLLSTTHGAESHALAAAISTMRTYQQEPVIETLYRQGKRLADGVEQAIERHQLQNNVLVIGKYCSLVFGTRDQQGEPCQAFRSLFLQETIRRGVLMPSLVISFAHSDEDVDKTIDAIDQSLAVYRKALDEGVENYLVGPPSQSVYRRFNTPQPNGLPLHTPVGELPSANVSNR